MEKNKLNNIIMLLFFIALVISGLMMQYGTRGNGLHFYWKNVHLYSAIIFIISTICHFILHAYWFKSLFKKQ
jgi:cytochrome b subunit of formate dehydrogenase